ncbi:MAG: hypothetical protein WCS77_06025 [Elusimicrobiaceae bacterium]
MLFILFTLLSALFFLVKGLTPHCAHEHAHSTICGACVSCAAVKNDKVSLSLDAPTREWLCPSAGAQVHASCFPEPPFRPPVV